MHGLEYGRGDGRAEMRSIFEASIGFFSPWKERLEIVFGHNCVPEPAPSSFKESKLMT